MIISLGEGNAAFTLYRGQEPLTLNMVAVTVEGAQEGWSAVEELYLKLSDTMPGGMVADAMPEAPALPWLATLLLPSFSLTPKGDVGFIGHMETCLGLLLAERLLVDP